MVDISVTLVFLEIDSKFIFSILNSYFFDSIKAKMGNYFDLTRDVDTNANANPEAPDAQDFCRIRTRIRIR